MHVRRIDQEPHPYAAPRGPVGPQGGQAGVGSLSVESRGESGSAPRTESSDAQLSGLVQRLKALPEARSEAIAAAREKVIQGDYLSRHAAERLSATELSQDYF